MNMRIFWPILLAALIAGGCCGDCPDRFLGSFDLQAGSLDWLNASRVQDRIFAAPGQPPVIMRYSAVELSYTEGQGDCTRSRCGLCCDDYEAQFAFLQLKAADETIVFDFFLQKDFLLGSPYEAPNTVGDYILITMDNRLPGELFLNSPALRPAVTLNGVLFNQVFVIEGDRSTANPNLRQPIAYYFNKAQGIVGFEYSNGEVFVLQP